MAKICPVLANWAGTAQSGLKVSLDAACASTVLLDFAVAQRGLAWSPDDQPRRGVAHPSTCTAWQIGKFRESYAESCAAVKIGADSWRAESGMRRGKQGCIECGRKIIVRRSPGVKRHGRVYRPLDDHDLCQRCFKAVKDRMRNRESDNVSSPT